MVFGMQANGLAFNQRQEHSEKARLANKTCTPGSAQLVRQPQHSLELADLFTQSGFA